MRTRGGGVFFPSLGGSGRIVPLMPLTEGAGNELGLPWMIPGQRAAKHTKNTWGMSSTKKLSRKEKAAMKRPPCLPWNDKSQKTNI